MVNRKIVEVTKIFRKTIFFGIFSYFPSLALKANTREAFRYLRNNTNR